MNHITLKALFVIGVALMTINCHAQQNTGILAGSVYWKYNTYVGDKPDAGAEVGLYSLDSTGIDSTKLEEGQWQDNTGIQRGQVKYETTVDVAGYYKFEGVTPGKYLLIVRSKNTTDCPEDHIWNLLLHARTIEAVFGLSLDPFRTQIAEIEALQEEQSSLFRSDVKCCGKEWKKKTKRQQSIRLELREKAEALIELFPDDFTRQTFFTTGYSKSYDFQEVEIVPEKTKTINVNFGNTCI